MKKIMKNKINRIISIIMLIIIFGCETKETNIKDWMKKIAITSFRSGWECKRSGFTLEHCEKTFTDFIGEVTE